jgi:hexosaminidase
MATQDVAIIPKPYRCELVGEGFTFNENTAIVVSPKTVRLGKRLQAGLAPATGLPLALVRAAQTNAVSLLLDEDLHDVGCEGYLLKATAEGVEIKAPRNEGIFYGIQTLLQLLPPAIFRKSKVQGARWAVPGVSIVDHPRFLWRGAHLDVSRHFMPKEFVLKWIDVMALHKLNMFHWHLTDSHGWRIEIKKYPELAVKGSRGDFSVYHPDVKTRSDSIRPGGCYTQDDVREIVAYAAERCITVLPEIELPGHSHAVLEVYPQYGNAVQIREAGGDTSFLGDPVWEEVFNAEPETIRFLQDVIDEVLEIFPSPFIHIGGDEVSKEAWKFNPRAQARMKELGLRDEDELQSWIVRQMDAYLQSKGRRLIGWDEILEGGLAEGATVMSWRGEEGGIDAAKAGHDVVMTPGSHTYFDHYQSRLWHREPLGIGGFTTVQKAYSYEPVPKELDAGEAIHVLGAQFQLWSEWLPEGRHVEYMTYPRGCASAEVFWSPPEGREWAEFSARLDKHLERLRVLDVWFRPNQPEPEPIGEWEIKKGDGTKTFEWSTEAKAGRCVAAITPRWRGGPFTVRDLTVEVSGAQVLSVPTLAPTDPHYRGCEVSAYVPKAGPCTVRATIEAGPEAEITGDAFFFAEEAL